MRGILILLATLLTALGLSLEANGKPELNVSPSYPTVAVPFGAGNETTFTKITVSSPALGNVDAKDLGAKVQVYLKDNKVDVEWGGGLPNEPKDSQVYGSFNKDAKQLDLWLPWHKFGLDWPPYHGVVPLKLGVDGDTSDAYRIVIPTFQGRWWPVFSAAVITLVLLVIPIVVINSSLLGYSVAGRRYGKIAALFLDKETDTYSLSKFQFYMWTSAAIFGYIVLTIARTLVQGQFEFADIPQGLPGIVLISAATTAGAQGITSTKGAKGAGPIYPSFSDFITTGGMVVPERFQFFVWTILGVFVFLFLVVFHDPDTLTELPKVPDGFLALMGISSFGYLGGKLARKPGPIVDDITAVLGTLTLTFLGRKLSSNCGFKVDGTIVQASSVKVSWQDPDDQAQPPEFYKQIVAHIDSPDTKWHKGGRHSATVINPDGQEAQWRYTLPSAPIINDIAPNVRGGKLGLVIRGEQLSNKAVFRIDGTELAKDKIAVSGSDSYEEYVPPGEQPQLYNRLDLGILQWDTVIKPGKDVALKITNFDQQESNSYSFRISEPKVTNVTPSKDGGNLKLVIDGSELSKDATFSINNKSIPPGTLKVDPESEDSATKLYGKLTLSISSPDNNWLKGGEITLTNPDGRQDGRDFPKVA